MGRHDVDAQHVLTVNTGSTSVRLALIEYRAGRYSSLAIDHRQAVHGDVRAALKEFLRRCPRSPDLAVHRAVHGGPNLRSTTRMNSRTLAQLRNAVPLAPAHLPAALRWIDACRQVLPRDTAQFIAPDCTFFAALPEPATTYALPRRLMHRHHIRRLGFHGFAHQSLLRRWTEENPGRRLPRRIITLHLGAGCSAAAIFEGRPVDTSMGFTPTEGLVMATRCGDVDAGLLTYLQRREHWTAERLSRCLTEESGLLGLCGSADLRVVLGRNSVRDNLAIAVFVQRLRKYIGAFAAVLGGLDAILISGGIGEHAAGLRALGLRGFEWLGLRLHAGLNNAAVGRDGCISARSSRVSVWVLAADEAGELARSAVAALMRRYESG